MTKTLKKWSHWKRYWKTEESPAAPAATTVKLSRRHHKLKKICKRDIKDFRQYGTTVVETEHGPLIHIDNGGDILAVGHLDWVLNQPPVFTDQHIFCGQLDDRLGVWGLLHGLQKYTDVKYDILLCDSEEVGNSTAQYFLPNKTYNWGFELDRAGTDCVLYDYAYGQLETLLEGSGWTIGCGAFSDISYLTHAGCEFVNFGIGYHGQHTESCYASLEDVEKQLERVAKFLDEHHTTPFPYEERNYYKPRPIRGFVDQEPTVHTPWYLDPEDRVGGEGLRERDYCVCSEGADEVYENWNRWTYCPYCGQLVS